MRGTLDVFFLGDIILEILILGGIFLYFYFSIFFQVNVQMEYSRKVSPADGATVANGPTDSRIMDFGSVFLATPSKAEGDDAATPASSASQQSGVNVAELVVARGFGSVIRHRDFEERSSYYDALLSAEARATAGKKGMHSSKEPPVMHITDLTTVRYTI